MNGSTSRLPRRKINNLHAGGCRYEAHAKAVKKDVRHEAWIKTVEQNGRSKTAVKSVSAEDLRAAVCHGRRMVYNAVYC